MNTTRIPKNLPPFTPNGNNGYDIFPARFAAAAELVSSMTYADFSAVMQQCGFSTDPR